VAKRKVISRGPSTPLRSAQDDSAKEQRSFQIALEAAMDSQS
jgi:hypothetical protein